MFRIVIENVALFLLPTLMYLAYAFFLGETVDAKTGHRRSIVDHLNDAPIAFLLAAGTALVVIAMVIFGAKEERNIDKPYLPAIFKDGKIIQQPGSAPEPATGASPPKPAQK